MTRAYVYSHGRRAVSCAIGALAMCFILSDGLAAHFRHIHHRHPGHSRGSALPVMGQGYFSSPYYWPRYTYSTRYRPIVHHTPFSPGFGGYFGRYFGPRPFPFYRPRPVRPVIHVQPPSPPPVTTVIRQPINVTTPVYINTGSNTGSDAAVTRVGASRAQPAPPKLKPNPPEPDPEFESTLGWKFLAAGVKGAAMRRFAVQSGQSPESGLPKVGIGLSAALGGDYRRAVRSFRKAFAGDAFSRANLPAIPGVESRVEKVARYYYQRTQEAPEDADAQFMLAALNYLLEEDEVALDAINAAVSSGDQKSSTSNLKEMLEKEIG